MQRLSNITHTVGTTARMFFTFLNSKPETMKILKTLGLFIVLAAAFLTSCDRDDVDEIVPREPDYQIDTVEVNPLARDLKTTSSEAIILDCIRIPFPVEFLQASGNTIVVNTEDEFEDATMLADSIVDFVYPFEVLDEDDNEIIIEEVEDLAIALTTCVVGPPADACEETPAHVLLYYNAFNIFTVNNYDFEVEFPFSLIVEGTEVVVNNEGEYIPAIGGNPSRFLDVEIVYPVTITQFGREIVLNSDVDVCEFWETLTAPCEDRPAHIQFFFNEGGGVPSNCAYFIDFPVSIELDGMPIQIQSNADYLSELNASPDAYDQIELVYPLTVIQFQDGDEISFQSADDICDYFNNICEY